MLCDLNIPAVWKPHYICLISTAIIQSHACTGTCMLSMSPVGLTCKYIHVQIALHVGGINTEFALTHTLSLVSGHPPAISAN